MKLLIVLFALTVVTVSAESFSHPEFKNYDDAEAVGENGCCAPDVWEGRVTTIAVKKHFFKPKFIFGESDVGFDYTKRQVAANTSVICSRTRKLHHVRSVANFNDKKAYVIYGDNKCKAFALKQQLQKPCIPSPFKKLTEFHLGVKGGESLNLKAFGYRNKSIEALVVTTQKSCIPVRSAFRMRSRKNKVMGKHEFFNIVGSIQNKGLFVLPASCKSALTEEEQEQENSKKTSYWGSKLSKYSPKKWWKKRQASENSYDLMEMEGHFTGIIHQLVDRNIDIVYENKPKKSWKKYFGGSKKNRS